MRQEKGLLLYLRKNISWVHAVEYEQRESHLISGEMHLVKNRAESWIKMSSAIYKVCMHFCASSA